MADAQETVADIIAEMREIHVAEFQDYADRLEAAHGRELARLREAEWLLAPATGKEGGAE